MVVFGAGDEEDTVAQAGPGFGLGAAMIGEHDDADVVFFGGVENRGASALGVVGILGVDVKDGPVVLIDAGGGRGVSAELHPFEALSVDGFEVRSVETLDGSAGEEEGGEKEGEGSHTFIVNGMGLYDGFEG